MLVPFVQYAKLTSTRGWKGARVKNIFLNNSLLSISSCLYTELHKSFFRSKKSFIEERINLTAVSLNDADSFD